MNWRATLETSLSRPQSDDPESTVGILSSVLVPIGWSDPEDPYFLLTKRTMNLVKHRGEVSFPGGLREEHDESLLHTALRETEEEIGLKARDLEVLGRIEAVRTIGEVWIHPWIGLFREPYNFVLNPTEVDRLIRLPLRRLLEEGFSTQRIAVGSVLMQRPGIVVDNEIVWGATAKILDLLRVRFLKREHPVPSEAPA